MKPLRVLGFSTTAGVGGGGRAAMRVAAALRTVDVRTSLLVQEANSRGTEGVFEWHDWRTANRLLAKSNSRLDRKTLQAVGIRSQEIFSPSLFSLTRTLTPSQYQDVDCIMLFWINHGFLSLGMIGNLLNLGKPVLWRLSDMWPFTGGCHYSWGCHGYERSCSACPQLSRSRLPDLAKYVLARKKKLWSLDHLSVVAPSRWIATESLSSTLLGGVPTTVIPPAIDGSIFRPLDRDFCRGVFSLPAGKTLVLFSADTLFQDRRKGLDLFFSSLDFLSPDARRDLHFVSFGSNRPVEPTGRWPLVHLGEMRDDRLLAQAFASCDIFVAPYREDNSPNTVIESLSCGTPVVAFSVGGISEFVRHGVNGYLARPFDTSDFAHGIELVARQKFDRLELHRSIQDRVGYPIVASQYREVILEAIHRSSTKASSKSR